jgi:transposase InsO family protein
MLDRVERRFDAIRAPQPVQWLAGNGSAHTAAETVDFTAALNLVPCFAPVRSPQSNCVCGIVVKTLKRDYARVNPGGMLSPSSSRSPPSSPSDLRR